MKRLVYGMMEENMDISPRTLKVIVAVVAVVLVVLAVRGITNMNEEDEAFVTDCRSLGGRVIRARDMRTCFDEKAVIDVKKMKQKKE